VTNQAAHRLLLNGLILPIDEAKCCTKYSTSSGIGRISTTVGSGREIQLDARFTFYGPSNCHLSLLAPCGDATNSRRFCKSRDEKVPQRFLTIRFIIGKPVQSRRLAVSPRRAIGWRLHCMVRRCRQPWSSTTTAATNHWITEVLGENV